MRDFILVLFGLAILIAAGESTLRGAVGLARRLNMPPAAIGASTMVAGAAAIGSRIGIPDSVLGLTLFAFGTSLPELVAALVAAWRGHTDVAVGNVIGSNIFNILGILGAASLVAPVPFTESLRLVDIWVLLAATCVLFPILITGWRIRRTEGLALFLLYLGYIASVAWRTGQPGVGGAP